MEIFHKNGKISKGKVILTAMAGAGVVGGVILMFRKFHRQKQLQDSYENFPKGETAKAIPSARKKLKTADKKALPSKDMKAQEPSPMLDPGQMAKDLLQFALVQNLTGVLFILKQIGSVEDYKGINEAYQKESERRTFITQRIVSSLLDKYFARNTTAKEAIKKEFTRMGLKVNPSTGKWSLSGFSLHMDIITIAPTYVKDWMGNRITVKAGTILGDEKSIAGGITWFKGLDNKMYQVPSRDVKYL